MENDALKKELAGIWAAFKKALGDYDLEKIRTLVDINPAEPPPPRAIAQEFARMLPDLGTSPCLGIKTEGDFAGFYADTSPKGETEVTIVRFMKSGDRWKLVPAPNTMSAVGTDQKKDKKAMIESEPLLRLVTEGIGKVPDAAPAPEPTAPDGPPPYAEDTRPKEAVRKELEQRWGELRDAFGKGDLAAAKKVLFLPPDLAKSDPMPEEMKAYHARMPDLTGSRFLRLVFHKQKPWLAGYYAAANSDKPTQKNVVLIVWARVGDRWMFVPGPGSLTSVDLPKAESTSLDSILKKHPELAF
jgi:hypothetical protein